MTDADAEGADPAPAGPDAESVVLDISGLSPEEVAALPDSVLGALLRRVHDTAGDPFVTGFSESM
ncbi:FxSxx-COOH cyclophane-containing RiPP peptide [Streptomyces sp. NRRL S-244]|uniref:FxSxx-COOH cyclophane-containing RiPP peptide n=1 Tax=Streptomyces sp. NRRL S-244 TaxID=1463897 RepID=UPI000A5C06CD|nr:FxSxx-COOH cyclophane-containing RiPP peptide [Streptomyces sp. NRRL S-244]